VRIPAAVHGFPGKSEPRALFFFGVPVPGKPLTDEKRHAIVELSESGMSRRAVAKAVGVDLTTVYRTLKNFDPDYLEESRRDKMATIIKKMTGIIDRTVDTLEPPEDASYMQRATVTGILSDKVAVLDRRLQEHKDREQQADPNGLALPSSIEALVGAIRNDLRGGGLLTLLQVRLDKDGDTLGESVQKLEDQMGVKLIEAEVTKIEDLDVGGFDAST
jgi:Homeodomain-like domain-containing protein